MDDSGMFQLDFRSERYLPFEGTGAISSWELSLPKGANRNLDFASISDVIVNLRYTALDGGEAFRQQVQSGKSRSIHVTKEQLDAIDDILLLVPFTGELDWSTPT